MGYNKQFIQNHALTASFNSSALDVEDSTNFSVHLDFTGSACTFSTNLQVSDYPTPPATDYGWIPLPGASQEDFTEAGEFLYNVYGSGYRWLRVVISGTQAGNSGRLNGYVQVK